MPPEDTALFARSQVLAIENAELDLNHVRLGRLEGVADDAATDVSGNYGPATDAAKRAQVVDLPPQPEPEPKESTEKRRERLMRTRAELNAAGIRNTTQILAKQENISQSYLRRLLRGKEQHDTPANNLFPFPANKPK